MDKKIKKYAKSAENKIEKTYKKVPKKKVAAQIATYGIKQLIGGPYFDIANLFWSKSKGKVIKYAGSYAYESFLRSKYAREQINTIPIALVSLTVRSILNFLILSKLKTRIYWLDFLISIIVTIAITLLSPMFYISIKCHEQIFISYTNDFVDNFLGPNGWEYINNFKNKIVFSSCSCMILVLQFVEVSSRLLQEIIIHTLITGYISDSIQNYINATPRKLYYAIENFPDESRYVIPATYHIGQAKKCNTKNIIFRSLKPIKITHITI